MNTSDVLTLSSLQNLIQSQANYQRTLRVSPPKVPTTVGHSALNFKQLLQLSESNSNNNNNDDYQRINNSELIYALYALAEIQTVMDIIDNNLKLLEGDSNLSALLLAQNQEELNTLQKTEIKVRRASINAKKIASFEDSIRRNRVYIAQIDMFLHNVSLSSAVIIDIITIDNIINNRYIIDAFIKANRTLCNIIDWNGRNSFPN